MKITIIEANDTRKFFNGIVWTVTGGCSYGKSCTRCEFGEVIDISSTNFNCLDYRDQYLTTVPIISLPHTFDTDDYPELLI